MGLDSPFNPPHPRGALSRALAEPLELRLLFDALIPVTGYGDIAYDDARDVLYITNGATVQRYDARAGVLLSPWTVGVTLRGLDVAPGGGALYVGEQQATIFGEGRIRKVDTDTGEVATLTYPLSSAQEVGSHDVVVVGGRALFTAHALGSVRIPVRQVDLATDAVTTRPDYGNASPSEGTRLTRGADRSLAYVTEAQRSDGGVRTFDAAANAFGPRRTTDLYLTDSMTAVSRNGSLIAMEISTLFVPTHTSVFDRNHNLLRSLPRIDGGIVFDPRRDVLYGVDSAANQVVAFDTNDWREKYRLNIGEDVGTSVGFDKGETAVDDEGSKLFLKTAAGVRVIDLPPSTGVPAALRVEGFPGLVKRGVPGPLRVTVVDPAGNVVTGYRGTISFGSGDPAAVLPADYTFTEADAGTHTFTATLNSPGARSIFAGDAAVRGTQFGIEVHDAFPRLIPVADHRALVFDNARGVLYITSGDGKLQRYDVGRQSLLAPLQLSANGYGADITPDGRSLYVADALRGPTQGMFRKVNLDTGAVTDLRYERAFYESGSADVAVAANGRALATTFFEGSGWTPLRQIDTASDTISLKTNFPSPVPRGEVRSGTQLWRSADRSRMFLIEPDVSSGPVSTYDSASDTFPAQRNTDRFYINEVSAANRDGTLLASSTPTGVQVRNANLDPVRTLPDGTGGLVFDPVRDLLYAVNPDTDRIVAYDTTTWAVVRTLPVGEDVDAGLARGNGTMAMSGDGQYLFLATATGVRVYDLIAPSVAGGAFRYQNGPAGHAVRLDFSEDVIPTAGVADLVVRNLATGQPVPDFASGVEASGAYGGPNFALWTATRPLADGNYRATLPAGAIADPSGNVLAGDFTFDFFVLSGDVNRDRAVNGTDFALLAANFGKTGMTYDKGDLNGDGAVNGTDFALLAANFGKALPPPPPSLTAPLNGVAVSAPVAPAADAQAAAAPAAPPTVRAAGQLVRRRRAFSSARAVVRP